MESIIYIRKSPKQPCRGDDAARSRDPAEPAASFVRDVGSLLPRTAAEGWVKKIDRPRRGKVWVGFVANLSIVQQAAQFGTAADQQRHLRLRMEAGRQSGPVMEAATKAKEVFNSRRVRLKAVQPPREWGRLNCGRIWWQVSPTLAIVPNALRELADNQRRPSTLMDSARPQYSSPFLGEIVAA
jgi:hypothetical protein